MNEEFLEYPNVLVEHVTFAKLSTSYFNFRWGIMDLSDTGSSIFSSDFHANVNPMAPFTNLQNSIVEFNCDIWGLVLIGSVSLKG